MKKLMCIISVIPLVLAGCGKDEAPKTAVVDDEGGYVVTVQQESASTLPKVKQTDDETSDNSEKAGNTSSSAVSEAVSDTSQSYAEDGDSTDENNGAEDSGINAVGNGKSENKSSVTAKVTSAAANAPEDIYYLEGIVYEVRDSVLFINETDLHLVDVGFAKKDSLKNIKAGDRVLITYNGVIAESYPAQAYNAYSVEVKEKADKNYELQQFSCKNLDYDLNFSLLVPSGWSSREIEYPTEGDFTDWGIRFTAEGQSKGLDISWFSSFAIRDPYDITPVTVNGKSADRYSRDGKWRFYVYDNNFVASNTFFGTEEYGDYTAEIEFMLETLEFS